MRIRESRRFSRENIAERVNPSQTPRTPPINTLTAAQKWQIGAEDIAYRPCRRCGRKRVRALACAVCFHRMSKHCRACRVGHGDDNRGHTPIGGRHEASPVLLRVPASYACERAQSRIGESCNNTRSSMTNTPSTP